MTTGRLSIVLATDSTVPSGVGEHMLTLARVLSPTCEAVLAFPEGGSGGHFLHRADAAGFETISIDEGFIQRLADHRPEILHVHAGIGWEGHELVAAGRHAGVVVVRTEHLPYLITDDDQKCRHRQGAKMADALIVVSDAAAESYRAEGFDDVVTIRNGVEPPVAKRTPHETRRALSIPETSPLVINVARFTAQKGHDCLLNAAAAVSRQMPDVVFVLVGDGPEREAMEAMAASLDAVNVMFLGERRDVPDLLAAADLFLLPSLFEGLPLVVLEAMALPIPIVATRIGGTVEALGDDHPYLVPPGEPAPLATMIIAALVDKPGRQAAGLRGLRRFHERFTAARMGSETATLYRSMTEKRHIA